MAQEGLETRRPGAGAAAAVLARLAASAAEEAMRNTSASANCKRPLSDVVDFVDLTGDDDEEAQDADTVNAAAAAAEAGPPRKRHAEESKLGGGSFVGPGARIAAMPSSAAFSLFLPGKPKAQQRHRTFMRNQATRQSSSPTKAGRKGGPPVMGAYNPSSGDKGEIIRKLEQHLGPQRALGGPGAVRVTCHFTFRRPKSHHRGSDPTRPLLPGAPQEHTSVPDIDNCLKLVLDALEGGKVFHNDAQVTGVAATKGWAAPGTEEGTQLEVSWG